MRGVAPVAAFGALTLAVACAVLPDIPANQCGNGVLDVPDEDCDPYGDAGAAAHCIPPGDVATQCRFACDPSGTLACPSGFYCGADSVCRAPSGKLEGTPTTASGAGAKRVLTGDFDGDHVSDVVTVGTGSTYVHYFQGRSEAQRVPISSLSSTVPAIGLLGDTAVDRRASAVVIGKFQNKAYRGGNFRVWRGAPDRTLLPTVYGTLDLTELSGQGLADGQVLPAFREGQIGSDVWGMISPDGTRFGIGLFVQADDPSDQTQRLLYLGASPQPLRSPQGIVGHIPIGRLGPGMTCTGTPSPLTVCENFVLAYKGDDYATIYPTCDADTGNVNGPGVNITTAAKPAAPIVLGLGGDTVNGRAFIGDAGGDAAVFVVGNAAVHEFTFDCAGDVTPSTLTGITPGPEPILALGSITGSGCVDWVGQNAIHVKAGPTCQDFPTAAPSPWTDAAIGDFNDNGLPDVIALSANGFDFYNGSGSVLFNALHTPVDGTPDHLTIGDFDGDFVTDFAFDVTGESGGATDSDLLVQFGQLAGFPLAPRSVGRLGSVAQLAPVSFDYVLSGTPDYIDTLFAIESASGSDVIVSMLQGSPDRLINSPFFLDPRAGQAIRQAAIGHFAGAAHAGIAGVSAGVQVSSKPNVSIAGGLLFVPATGDAQLVVSQTVGSILPALSSDALDEAAVAALDVGGPAGDELVVLAPKSTANDSCFLYASVTAKGWQPSDCEANVTDVIAAPKLSTADLDGDGKPDLVATYTNPQNEIVARVAFNDQAGSISLAAAATVPPLPQGTLVAVAPAHVGPGGGTQLLALGTTGLWVGRVVSRQVQFDPTPIAPFDATDADAPVVYDVAAADVDGDGIDDAIVGTSSGLEIYHGIPTH